MVDKLPFKLPCNHGNLIPTMYGIKTAINIAEYVPEVFRLEKNFENQQKHQKRRSAYVGQADFGKLQLNNIRNDSGNSQRLSVLSAKRDQFETRSIRNKRGRMFRPWHFRGRTRELLSLAILRLYASVASTWVGLCHARLKVVALNLQWFRDLGASFFSFGCFVFKFWVFHFRVLGASFSSLGCFVFEFRVLRF